MSKVNGQSLRKAFYKGPDKYRETYTDAERANQRKEIKKFINTRKLIYDKLNALKKKNNWTDKDLELRGLYPHKLLDPWLNAYKEGRLAISGGGASLPVDITTGALPTIASVIRGEHKTADPEAPSYVLEEYGDVDNLAEAINEAAIDLEYFNEMSESKSPEPPGVSLHERPIRDAEYFSEMSESKYDEPAQFETPIQQGTSAADDEAIARVRNRMATVRRQILNPNRTGRAAPNTVRANNLRQMVEQLFSSSIWAQDPSDPFRIFDDMSVNEQKDYVGQLMKKELMDDETRQRILDLFTRYGVNLVNWGLNAKNEAVRELELGLRQNDLLNDDRTPLQRRADLINDLRTIFMEQLNTLPPNTVFKSRAGGSTFQGVTVPKKRTASDLRGNIKIRPRKIVEPIQGEEIQSVPSTIIGQSLDEIMSEMERVNINPRNIRNFRTILTTGFQNDVMWLYETGLYDWESAVEKAWIENERRINEYIEMLKREDPALRYDFSNLKQLLMRIRDSVKDAAGAVASIPSGVSLVGQAIAGGEEGKDALRDIVMSASRVAEEMKSNVLMKRNTADLSAMRGEMDVVATSTGINLSDPTQAEFLDARRLFSRLIRDARDRGEAFSINLGSRLGRIGMGISTRERLSRRSIFAQMDEEKFDDTMREYAISDIERAEWEDTIRNEGQAGKDKIIDILIRRAAGRGAEEFPDEPPDEPDGMITITTGRYRRTIKLSAWIAALIGAGVGVKKIVDYVKKLKDDRSGGEIKDGEKNDDTNIPTKPSDTGGEVKPMPPKPKPDPQFADDTPTLSAVEAPDPDPTLGAYPIDTKGISRMGISPDVLDNINNYNELVRQYNQNIKDYETYLTTGEPAGLFGTGVANAADVNGQIAKLMLEYKAKINNALPSLAQLPTGREATALAQPAQSRYAFKQYSDGPLMKYNEMRKSATTKRLGLDDDIDAYNDKVKSYNKKIDELAAKNPESGPRPKVPSDVEYSINDAFKSLSAEMSPVARAERIGRPVARDITYSATDRAVIDKFISANIEKGAKLQLTPEEEASIADNPELFDRIQKYQELLGRARTKEDVDKLASYKDYFAKVKANDYKPLSFVKPVSEQYEMDGVSSGMNARGFEAGLKQEAVDATKVFNESKKSYQAAQARLASAIASGAPKHQISQLYQDMDNKRVDYNTKQARYSESLTKLKDYGGVKTTYLGDMSAEVIPRTADERHLFARLQNVEAAIQANPDALKMYNEKAMTIHKNQNPLDIYRKRLDYLATISQQYGMAQEYAAAMSESLKAVETVDEEPMAQIDVPEDDVNDNDQQYRAEMIDPAEAKLFLSTKQQAEAEQRRWQEFSTVAPNNGLGNPKTNPLLRAEVNQYITRYANTTKGPKPSRTDIDMMTASLEYQRRGRVAQRASFSRRPSGSLLHNTPRFTPEIQCAFGQDHFENEFVIPSMVGGEIVTRADDDLPDNRYSTWVKPSIYHPEYEMMVYNNDLASSRVMEGPSYRDAKYRFLPQTVRPQYYPIDTREYLGKTMSDSFGSRLNFNNTLNTANLNKVGAVARPTMSIYDNDTIKKLGVKYR